MNEYNPVWTGQILQNIGKATIELKNGNYEAVINRLLPYLTRTDYPEEIRAQAIELFRQAVEKLRPQRYEFVAKVSKSRVKYIAIPSNIPIEAGEEVRVILEKR